MNNFFKIVLTSVAATSAMTAFSYAVSEKKNKQFREPALLRDLLKRVAPQTTDSKAEVAGWTLHYGVGLLFTAAYSEVWKNTEMSPSMMNGTLIGSASGIAGAAVWKTVFNVHPNPPKIDYTRYYLHLIAAHAVFGITAAVAYKLLDGRR
ncbi:hypothetical protein [Pseudochryseolinea flava]|nr:hypothetical protein [Pseudochryseolinea flava]